MKLLLKQSHSIILGMHCREVSAADNMEQKVKISFEVDFFALSRFLDRGSSSDLDLKQTLQRACDHYASLI